LDHVPFEGTSTQKASSIAVSTDAPSDPHTNDTMTIRELIAVPQEQTYALARIAKVCNINNFYVHIQVLFNDALCHSVTIDDRRLNVIAGFSRMIVTREKLKSWERAVPVLQCLP